MHLCVTDGEREAQEVKDRPESHSWKAVGWIQAWIWVTGQLRSLHRPTQLRCPERIPTSHKLGEPSPVCLLAKESLWGKHSSPRDLHGSFSSLLILAQLFTFSRGLP